MNNQILGGWTPFESKIDPEEREVFSEAMKGFVGVEYTPVAVATQVVQGTNYNFFCNAKVAYPNSPNYAAMVTIYRPLEGNPHITEIRKV